MQENTYHTQFVRTLSLSIFIYDNNLCRHVPQVPCYSCATADNIVIF